MKKLIQSLRKISKRDWVQIGLNLLAFIVLMLAPTGKGSFWGFTTFFVLAGLILLEISLSKDKTAIWIWITKTTTYAIFVLKFSSNIGEFHWQYIVMIVVSICTLLVSRKLIKSRSIAMWGTNTAYVIGGVMYIVAVVSKPEDYDYNHIIFWFINAVSYGILIWQILSQKKDKVNLIIPVYAFTFCIVYICIIYCARQAIL
jgi:hypothetical protein